MPKISHLKVPMISGLVSGLPIGEAEKQKEVEQTLLQKS
jgi:hypothetical protein